jgi:hypothetical protein
MEPRKRTHVVNELMQEAHLMMGVLEKAMEAKQREAQQRAESQHITDDEPTPPRQCIRYRMSTPAGKRSRGH